MSSFTVQALEEKLSRLTASQDSIETLSLWIIHHKAHATTSVTVWTETLKKADADHRLILLYLANDILQNGRRKGTSEFMELFRDPLRQAATIVRGEKIQTSVERMLRIWRERKVYSNVFIKELECLIEPGKVKDQLEVSQPKQFKMSLLGDAITELRKFEGEMKVKSSHFANLRMDVSDTSTLARLKDKSDGGKFSAEFEETSLKLQDYCECLGIEVNERVDLVAMLVECKAYMAQQLDELQKTTKNYHELGVQIARVRDKLEHRVKELARAQQTATSDPSAKEDITDVGDMEIDSDTETQESVAVVRPTGHPNTSQLPPFIHRAPPVNPAPVRPQAMSPPRGYPPTQQAYQPRPLFRQAPPPRPYAPPPQVPYQARVRPPPQPRAPIYRPPVRLPLAPQPPPRAVRPANTISAPPLMYTSSQPLAPAPSLPTSSGPTQTSVTTPEKTAPSPSEDISPSTSLLSLDDRLKDMVTLKAFPKVLLTDYSDSDSDSEEKGWPQGYASNCSPLATDMETDRPYSPSGEDLVISDPCTPLDRDDGSIPTPTTEVPTPEASPGPPQLNMDNPILQVLYRSQETPGEDQESKPLSPPPMAPNLNSGLLQRILNQVNRTAATSESMPVARVPPAQVNQPSQTISVHPSPRTEGRAQINAPLVCGASGVRTSTPMAVDSKGQSTPDVNSQSTEGGQPVKDIKITQSLTTLLDEIFPQLSKTLQMERKRKFEGGPSPEPKAQRPAPNQPPSTPGRTVIEYGHRGGGGGLVNTATAQPQLHPPALPPRGPPVAARAQGHRMSTPLRGSGPLSSSAFRPAGQLPPTRVPPPPRQPNFPPLRPRPPVSPSGPHPRMNLSEPRPLMSPSGPHPPTNPSEPRLLMSPTGPRPPMNPSGLHPSVKWMPHPLPPTANIPGNSRFPPSQHNNHFPPKPFPPHSNSVPHSSYSPQPPPSLPTTDSPISAPPNATPTPNRPQFM